MIERIHFELFGLQLQEPMALILNWLITSVCFYSFFKIKQSSDSFVQYWRLFFAFLGLSTLFGGIGHLFFYYWGWEGKYPAWILGAIAVFMSSVAMLEVESMTKFRKRIWIVFLTLKTTVMIILSLIYVKFIFIAVDAVIGYLFFCMSYGLVLMKRGYNIRQIVLGVFVLLPSIVFFVGKIACCRWMNEQDLGHLFMIAALLFFYFGVQSFARQQTIKA
jgi:hypothetical protein